MFSIRMRMEGEVSPELLRTNCPGWELFTQYPLPGRRMLLC